MIFCETPGCICYPVVLFECVLWKECWWTHCRWGYLPMDFCVQCYRSERSKTEQALWVAEISGKVVEGFPAWWEVFAKGVNPETGCGHPNEPKRWPLTNIFQVLCRTTMLHLLCTVPQVKARNWAALWTRKHIQGGYDCCREDGQPCCSLHQSRRRRQSRMESDSQKERQVQG